MGMKYMYAADDEIRLALYGQKIKETFRWKFLRLKIEMTSK